MLRRWMAVWMVSAAGAALLLAGCAEKAADQEGDVTAPAETTARDDAASASADDDAGAPEAAVGQYKIGMSQCNLGEPWRVQMNEDIRATAAEYAELNIIFKDAQNDTLRQRAHIEEFVSDGVDLLIVSPLEAAPLTEPIAKAYQAGIPVIVLDRDVLGDQYTVFIGADNTLIGEAAGRWAAQALKGKGDIVELKGLMTTVPGHDRSNGFHKGIEGTEINVIFEADMKWLEPNARKEMESALARFPKIDLVYAHNDPAAHGAYLAAAAAGREDEMIFIGIDALPQEGRAYVEQGLLDVTFEYPTGGMEAVETARALFRGEDVPKRITLRSRFFTPENIASGGEWIDRAFELTGLEAADETADAEESAPAP